MIGVPGARPTIVPPLPGCTPLFDGAAMREADRHASERHGLPSILLMERAGLATAEAIRARWDGRGGVWVIVGPGNNGGDGLVVARHLAEAGWAVRVLAPAGRAPAGADAAVMVRVAASLGIVIEPLGEEDPPADAVVVDALLGTGASGLPRGAVGEAIAWIGRHPGSVVAVDIPSGVAADTGVVAGASVSATLTVTYHGDMVGLRVAPGKLRSGEVLVADIGIPSAVTSVPVAWAVGPSACGALPLRGAGDDKYSAGAVLVVAGAPGMAGAAVLAALAALRAGAGLCVAAVPAVVQPTVAAHLREVMCVGLPERDGHLGPESLAPIVEQAERVAAVAIGPGLGRRPETTEMVVDLLAALPRPVVLDADGLWHLAHAPAALAGRPAATVITPHAGEAARLLGWDRTRVEARRLEAAGALVERFGATVVLKGPGTVIATPGERPLVDNCGTSALATAGSGDVLAGAIAALLASGLSAPDAAASAVALHGCAGRLADRGPGTTASDLIEALPAVPRGAQ